jgi:D-galactarolactone cycloisomerase
MKIREIKALGLYGPPTNEGWYHDIPADECGHTLIVISTDEGVYGLGSVYTSVGLVKGALQVLEPMYLGESAIEPERVSEKLHQNTFWQGRGGAITNTISGIDIALWDIFGKVTGQPIGRLLGGRYRERVKPYASLVTDYPDALREALLPLKEQGFRAFKIGWGPFGRESAALDEAIVRTARETIGPDCMLMIDPGASEGYWPHGYKWALRTAHMLAEYNVDWFEEALNPDVLDDFVRLRTHSPVPISGGEVLTRRQSYVPWLSAGAFDIVQPDVTKVGGISELRRIANMAQDHGVRVIPHGWNTAIGVAADLQIASAIVSTELIEFSTGSHYIDALPATPWQLDADGMLPIPDAPGLGLTLNLDALERYTREPLPDILRS